MLGRYERLQDYWDDALAVFLSAAPDAAWPTPSLTAAIVAGKLLGDARHRELAQRRLNFLTDDLKSVRDESQQRTAKEWTLLRFQEFVDAMVVS